MKISKRTREQAARICSVVASNAPHLFYLAEEWIGIPTLRKAGRLARDAFYAAQEGYPRTHCQWIIAAEAEALLRTGWTP